MPAKGFFELLFGSFFRWWWAVITGFASILSLVFIPDRVWLSKGLVTILIFVGLTLTFLCLSTVYQGWLLYQSRFIAPKFLRFHELQTLGAEYVCLLDGVPQEANGKIAQLKRTMNDIDVPFAVIEFGDRNAQGQIQARVLWIAPGHLRDLKSQQFAASDIVVDLFVNQRSILELVKTSSPVA